jgi:hypothetical protein
MSLLSLLEELLEDLRTSPESRDEFVKYRDKLRKDIPVPVSRHFAKSYGLLDSETKVTVRELLLAWLHNPATNQLQSTPFLKSGDLSWVHFQTDVLAVLASRNRIRLWIALFQVTRDRIPIVTGSKPLQISPKLRQYLDEV